MKATKKIVVPFKFKPLYVLGCIVFIAGGWFMAFHLPTYRIVERSVGFMSMAFFGSCFCFYVFRSLNPQPAVVIDSDGLFDRASAVGVGLILWNEIKRIHVYDYKTGKTSQRILGITPQDPQKILMRLGWFKRTVLGLNKYLGTDVINVPQVALGIPLDQLALAIKKTGYFKGQLVIDPEIPKKKSFLNKFL